jgi:hypothetical protein
MLDSAEMRDAERDDYEELADVRHPDHDLSEWSTRFMDGTAQKPWFLRRGVLLLVGGLVIASLLLPVLIQIL